MWFVPDFDFQNVEGMSDVMGIIDGKTEQVLFTTREDVLTLVYALVKLQNGILGHSQVS